MAERLAAAPGGLGVAGRRLWKAITTGYTFRQDELRLLEDACREVDLIARLQAEVDKGPLIVAGSRGQETIHPLLSEVRQHRLLLARLLRQLRLEDDPAKAQHGAGERSSSAREAALARWRRPPSA